MAAPEKGSLPYGAWNALKHSLNLSTGETVVIVTDEATTMIGDAFVQQATQITGSQNDVTRFSVDDCGDRPITDLPDTWQDALTRCDVAVYCASTPEGEIGFRRQVWEAATENKGRMGHAPGITEDIMLSGMQADIQESNRICTEIFNRVKDVETMAISTDLGYEIMDGVTGTDLTVECNTEWNWVNSNWETNPGEWHNVPAGEVFTTPFNASGIYIVDGVLGDYFDEKYGSLQDAPVVYFVEDNEVYRVKCPGNRHLEADLRAYLDASPADRKLGEIGIGGLPVDNLVYNLLQDEKMLGTIHIAHGSNYAGKTNSPENGAELHCDGVIRNPTVELGNGDTLLRNGTYQPPEHT